VNECQQGQILGNAREGGSHEVAQPDLIQSVIVNSVFV